MLEIYICHFTERHLENRVYVLQWMLAAYTHVRGGWFHYLKLDQMSNGDHSIFQT